MVLVIKSKLGLRRRFNIKRESRSAKFKVDKGGGSKDGKPTCANCGKKHYSECLLDTEVALVVVNIGTK